MPFSVYLLPEAKKKFDKLPSNAKKRVENLIRNLAEFPDIRSCIKVQGKENIYRLRAGDYRILFKVYSAKDIIVVADIDKRGRIYKRMR